MSFLGVESWDRRTVISVVATLVFGFLPIICVFVLPLVWRQFGRVVGFLLKRKTDGRRSVLVSVMDEENEQNPQGQSDSKSSSSDEWEKIGEEVAASKLNSKGKEWDGIIGFFHPFWYAPQMQ